MKPIFDYLFSGLVLNDSAINEDVKNLMFEEKKEINEINTNNNIDENRYDNWIEGIINIAFSEINKCIVLFNSEINYPIDVFIDDKKISIKKIGNNWMI